MARIDLAQKKWETKVPARAAAWKRGVTGKEDAYCKGLSEFMGLPCNPEKVASYREGVGIVTPEDFAAAVRGKGAKWRARYIEAMSGAR